MKKTGVGLRGGARKVRLHPKPPKRVTLGIRRPLNMSEETYQAKQKAQTKKPDARQRQAALSKALIIALRVLPEDEVVALISTHWLTIHRLDLLKGTFP